MDRYFALESYAATLEEFCNGKYKCPMPSHVEVLFEIGEGVNFLHSNGIVHGNLNPQTIVISQSAITGVRMKVADFGLHKFVVYENEEVNNGGAYHYTSRIVRPLGYSKYWMNVKLLKVDKEGNPSATINNDIFAIGCLFFYYLKKESHPFGHEQSIVANISNENPVSLKGNY